MWELHTPATISPAVPSPARWTRTLETMSRDEAFLLPLCFYHRDATAADTPEWWTGCQFQNMHDEGWDHPVKDSRSVERGLGYQEYHRTAVWAVTVLGA